MTTFFVPGIPAPQGSKTFKGFRGGKPILAESSAKVKPWRAMVTTTAYALRATILNRFTRRWVRWGRAFAWRDGLWFGRLPELDQ